MEIKIERVIMSGRGPKYTYKLVSGGKTMFQSQDHGGYMAWTRKKDAQAVIDAIEYRGLESVEQELKRKAF